MSRQYLGSRGQVGRAQVGNGIVAATKGPPAAHPVVRARAACVAFRALLADGLCNPRGWPHFITELDRATPRTGPGRLPGPLRLGDPTPLTPVDVFFRFR
ncbi:hypothetical protein [Streptomyces umbrinus]|uniref:hypothetical protein n=1 Tax=Streptomyces umbrinus TaxID=67370 RepID=UPI00340C180D